MRRPAAAALLALLLALSASPVAAHGNHVEVDSQRSADGTVYVEAVRPQTDGFLVLHRETDGGDVGEPIGHTGVGLDDGFQRGVPVEMDADAWADWPAQDTVWVVFHADDGDGAFEPAADPVTEAFGRVTGQKITLAKADRPARVLAERSEPQRTNSRTVTVDEVATPADGFLVLRTEDATEGPVVASKALSAGVHQSVRIDVDGEAFVTNDSATGLYAQLYTDDGDGEFDAADEPVRAGETPVNTYFLVHQTENGAKTTTESLILTPTTDETNSGVQSTTIAADSNSTVPGYGLTHALAALGVAVLVAARRR